VSFSRLVEQEFLPWISWDSIEHEVDPYVFECNTKQVDVVVCTYNSERFLEPCLASIVRNVPVKTLWIIDNYSKDGTLMIARRFGANIIKTHGSLAEARKLSFLLAETPLFVNVDSDVILCKDWYRKIMKYWNRELGALSGITIDQHPLHSLYLQSMWKMRDATSYDILHLPNAVFRADLLRDFSPPKGLCYGSVASEDEAIKAWINRKGFKIANCSVFSKHYSFPPLIDNKTYWYGAGARLAGLITFKSIFLRFVLAFPQAIYSAVRMHNARLIWYCIRYRYQILYGYLHANKYFNLKRRVGNA
jgi:glycosyltransferase involved in cell wall biosynthesis